MCYAVVNLDKQSLYLVNQSGTVTLDSLTPNKRILIGLRLYLRTVHILHVETHKSLLCKNEHKLCEYVIDLVLQTVAETVDCYEVRLFISCQPDEMDVTHEQLLYPTT